MSTITSYPVCNPNAGVIMTVPACSVEQPPKNIYNPELDLTPRIMDLAYHQHREIATAILVRGVRVWFAHENEAPPKNSYPMGRRNSSLNGDEIFKMDSKKGLAVRQNGVTTPHVLMARMTESRRHEEMPSLAAAVAAFQGFGYNNTVCHFIQRADARGGLEYGDAIRIGNLIVMGQSYNAEFNREGRTTQSGHDWFAERVNVITDGKVRVEKATFEYAFHHSTFATFAGWDSSRVPVVVAQKKWIRDFSCYERNGIRIVGVPEHEKFAGNVLHLQGPNGPFVLVGAHYTETIKLLRRELDTSIEIVPVDFDVIEKYFAAGLTCLCGVLDIFDI